MEVPLLDSSDHVWGPLDAWINLYFPTSLIGSNAEDRLTSTTGLDEEELGLPSQAGAASSIEGVHNFLNGHRTSICAINSPWELEVAGLEDQELW